MIVAFVLIAGTLATAAALLLLTPLLRRREDARPAAAITSIAVLLVVLLGGAGLYAMFSNYKWNDTTVQFNMYPKGAARTSFVVGHLDLTSADAVETNRAKWKAALGALAGALD